MCCLVKALIAPFVLILTFFGVVTLLIVLVASDFEHQAESNIAAAIDKFTHEVSGERVSGVQSKETSQLHDERPVFPCECYDWQKAKNISLERRYNYYDVRTNDVITVKDASGNVRLIWDITKTQKANVVGPIFAFNYARWDKDHCYKPYTVQSVVNLKKRLKKHTFMTSPYSLVLKETENKAYQYVCEDCRLGILPSFCA
jgi:hypothetical protein